MCHVSQQDRMMCVVVTVCQKMLSSAFICPDAPWAARQTLARMGGRKPRCSAHTEPYWSSRRAKGRLDSPRLSQNGSEGTPYRNKRCTLSIRSSRSARGEDCSQLDTNFKQRSRTYARYVQIRVFRCACSSRTERLRTSFLRAFNLSTLFLNPKRF